VKKSKLRRKRARLADRPNNGLSQQFLHCYSPEFWLHLRDLVPSSARGRENGKTEGETRKSFWGLVIASAEIHPAGSASSLAQPGRARSATLARQPLNFFSREYGNDCVLQLR
jgi:hypothetical protein